MTVTVGPGINMLKLNEELEAVRRSSTRTPAGAYPCSLVGGRIACSGWSLLGSRFGHTRITVVSFEFVLPDGEIIRVGGRRREEGPQAHRRATT